MFTRLTGTPCRPLKRRHPHSLDGLLELMYAADISGGRQNIAPEKLLRATLLNEVLHTAKKSAGFGRAL